MVTVINNAMLINKIASKIKKFFTLKVTFFSFKFVGTVFVSSTISSHVFTESSIILAKYFLVSQLHVAGFDI